ncbi:MAG: arylsulfatase [Acidobacteria bacterium]|nr:arylsulfatase [Acidobacteriota bacterium]
MNRRQFLSATSLATLKPAVAAAAPLRPNIVFILADDLGYGDIGCYGQQQIRTPNIDRLAAEGIRFTDGYAGAAVCAPSRCSLITGLHTGHARTRANRSPNLPLRPQDITVAEVLKQAGYRTGLFGKWSLGELGSTGYPTRKGFDEWFGFFNQTHAHNYYPELLLEGETALLQRGNMGTQKKDYAPDKFTEHALSFIQRNSGTTPFFLHVCYTIPHTNNEMGRDTGNGQQVPSDEPYSGKSWPQVEKNFAAMITRMDRDVGRIVEQLKKSGQDENTLIIFTSDNGPHKEGGHNPGFFESAGPLRGIKRDVYEGGIRVPSIARWPARVRAGQVSKQPWAFWDVLPTAAELAGVPCPAGLDGISIVPTLLGGRQPQHEYLYWESRDHGFDQAVRMGDWKGVRHGRKGAVELYALSSDLSERRDVAAQHPDVAAKIARIMDAAHTESKEFPVREAPARKAGRKT